MTKHIINSGYFEWENSEILVFTITVEESKPEDVIDYFEKLTDLTEHASGNFILIVDATIGKWMDERVRKVTAQKIKEFNSIHKGRIIRRYYVIQSTVVRMMLKAINLLIKARNFRSKSIFSTREKAVAFATEELTRLKDQTLTKSA